MPYGKLLRKMLVESNYTATEIAEECKKRGIRIDKSYISKLQNDKCNCPNEKISSEIAKICNKDERLLVLEGYIDNAPQEVKELLYSIRLLFSTITSNVLSYSTDKTIVAEFEKLIKNEPISEFILNVIDNKDTLINIDKNIFQTVVTDNGVDMILTQPPAISVADNAMFPLITEKSKVCLSMQTNYENGDIVAVKINDKDNIIIRQIFFKDNEISLIPLNKNYFSLTYDLSNIVIIGKVTSIINEL